MKKKTKYVEMQKLNKNWTSPNFVLGDKERKRECYQSLDITTIIIIIIIYLFFFFYIHISPL